MRAAHSFVEEWQITLGHHRQTREHPAGPTVAQHRSFFSVLHLPQHRKTQMASRVERLRHQRQHVSFFTLSDTKKLWAWHPENLPTHAPELAHVSRQPRNSLEILECHPSWSDTPAARNGSTSSKQAAIKWFCNNLTRLRASFTNRCPARNRLTHLMHAIMTSPAMSDPHNTQC